MSDKNAVFISFLLNMLEHNPVVQSIISWKNQDKEVFIIKNKILLSYYWAYYFYNKNKSVKKPKVPSIDWDKTRRHLMTLKKLGVIEDLGKDHYKFFWEKCQYEKEEIKCPFHLYQVKFTKDIEVEDTIEKKLERIETTLDLLLENQKILFSLLQFDYMEHEETFKQMPDLTHYLT